MPHLILTQSKNITHNSAIFFKKAHQLLSEMLPTELSTCKSRLILADNYLISDGEIQDGLVHLEIAVLVGRSEELLKNISKQLYQLLNNHLIAENVLIKVQLSVEIRNLSESYFKG